MNIRIPIALVAAMSLSGLAVGTLQAQVTKESVPGVTNFARVSTTIACAGATTPAAMVDINRLGFRSVINLRLATEAGASIEESAAAAKAAGLNYVHLPFNTASPDPTLVDRFLVAVTAPANQPAFVHCGSGNRAAALWMIKRMSVDGWDADRASAEATALGLTNPALKTFALDWVAAHKK
ncbi:MAG: hypothetical protein EXQ59_04045 [Acidobacteria bacterium]|nr:hypothetical protein [Acidobacteriota bacterium]